jgi:hypothetical protein
MSSEESFILPVEYQHKTIEFPALLRIFAHTHKIEIQVGETAIVFEPDEERNYRAVVNPEEVHLRQIDTSLLKAIAGALETAFK